MQQIYNLFKLDPLTYQGFMEEIVEGEDIKVSIKVLRERMQRWLANQRNASWIVETFNKHRKKSHVAAVVKFGFRNFFYVA